MKDRMAETEELVHHGRIKVPYRWWVGETGSRFLVALRDEQRILGTRCPACDRVFVPPRRTCGQCFHAAMEWREVGPEGTLVTYTVPQYEEAIHPRFEGVFAFGIVRLDGADTGLAHLVGEFGARELRAGLRVEAVFREQRVGDILDIRCFRPVRNAA